MTEQLLERGDRLRLTRLDMTDLIAIRQVVNQAFADLSTIDVIVNNAGYPSATPRKWSS